MKLANQTQASIVAAVCLLGLVVALKNLLHVPAEVITKDIVLYIIIYTGVGVVYPTTSGKDNKSRLDNPLLWSVLIVLMTLAIILLYAL